MNREQRRKQQRIDAKKRKEIFPGGYLEFPKDEEELYGIKDGDIYTIAGLKRNKDWTLDRNCRPGEETRFIVKIKD